MDESILNQKYVVIYPGRFQPFHAGHKEIYDVITKKFGKDNVYLATSNKVELPKSPFNFIEKKKIITTMFKDIPIDRIVEVKNGYRPVEIVDKFPKETVAIFVVGNKDAERLQGYGTYFKPLNEKTTLEGYKDRGYYYIAPSNKLMYKGSPLSGSRVRDLFNRYDEEGKADLFERLYGSMDKNILALVSKKIVKESEIDDGPSFLKEDKKELPKRKAFTPFKATPKKTLYSIDCFDCREPLVWGEIEYVDGSRREGYECIACAKKAGRVVHPIRSIQSEENNMPDFLITEGGAYGHLSHFHDIKTNTFSDLREFIDTVLQGKMDYARIKTDGMNLMFSFIDGHLRAARNQGDLKNFGKNSLTIDSLNKKFEGRDNIQNAFTAAARDLQHAIGKLPKEQVDEIFENGKNWMSVEVINPQTKNVIPYGTYELRFHGIRKFDEKGNVVGEDKQAAEKLSKMISDIKQNKQDTYEIKSLEVASFPPLPDFKAQRAYFDKKVDHLQSEFGMKDKNTIADVFHKEFEKLIKTHAREARYTIPKAELEGLINRWAFNDTSFKAREIQSIKNETFRDWALDFDNEGASHFAKEISNKFEYLTLELGARVLKNLSSFMVANPKKSVQDLKKGIDDVIKQVQASKNPEMMEKMKYELERLSSIGGVNAIAPEEGVTFIFKDNFYKLTGAFAPVNQLLGLMRYNRK